MKNSFNRTIADLYALLTVEINSVAGVKTSSRDEIYTNEGSYLEIVGMKKRINLFKRLLPTGIIDAIVYIPKMKFNKQSFSVNNRVFTIYN